MSRAVEVLRGDHQTFFILLDLIEREIEIFSRAEQPDYTLLEAILEYLRTYCCCAHHPAESFVYERLRLRAPELCAGIPDPGLEHQHEEQRLDALRHLVRIVLEEGEIPRHTVIETARGFVHHMRNHLEIEEAQLLPAALTHLHGEDWTEIDRRFGEFTRRALDSGAAAELDALRADILRWCTERGETPLRQAS